MPNGRIVRYCGIVTLRQQPETANGTVFISLEDETGVVQVICWKSLRDAQRKELLRSRLLVVYGTWQREGDVKNLIAGQARRPDAAARAAGDRESGFQVRSELLMDTALPIAPRRIHLTRLMSIWRSAGWPCRDAIELDLVAAGWATLRARRRRTRDDSADRCRHPPAGRSPATQPAVAERARSAGKSRRRPPDGRGTHRVA